MVSTASAVGMGVTSSFVVAVVALFALAAALGVMSPTRQAYLHEVTSSDHRATVVSCDAMISSVGGVGGQVGLGAVSDARSFSAGYVVGGSVTILALPLLLRLRQIGEAADRLGPGESADVDTTCPAGIPRETGVQSLPVPTLVGADGDR